MPTPPPTSDSGAPEMRKLRRKRRGFFQWLFDHEPAIVVEEENRPQELFYTATWQATRLSGGKAGYWDVHVRRGTELICHTRHSSKNKAISLARDLVSTGDFSEYNRRCRLHPTEVGRL